MIRELYDVFRSHERRLYTVGGAVRDTILGVPFEKLPDIDFVTDASREEVEQFLVRYHPFRLNRDFGTVGVIYGGKRVEITSYKRGLRGNPVAVAPELERLAHDLSNRDFTCDAIAMDVDGNYIDPFGGMQDIDRRLIRAVNNTPDKMLKQHPIRALRCARFVSTLGFQADDQLFDAIQNLGYLLKASSPEVIKEEMDKLLTGKYVGHGLQFSVDSLILDHILPEILPTVGLEQPGLYHHKDVWGHTKMVVENVRPYTTLRWAALLHDSGKPRTRSVSDKGVHFYGHEKVSGEIFDKVARRLRFSNEERSVVRSLITNHMRMSHQKRDLGDSSVRRLVRDCGDYLEELMELSRADITSHRPETVGESLQLLDELKARIEDLKEKNALDVRLPTDVGNAIMDKLGVKAGPEVGRQRKLLEEAIVRGELPASPTTEACIEFLNAHHYS